MGQVLVTDLPILFVIFVNQCTLQTIRLQSSWMTLHLTLFCPARLYRTEPRALPTLTPRSSWTCLDAHWNIYLDHLDHLNHANVSQASCIHALRNTSSADYGRMEPIAYLVAWGQELNHDSSNISLETIRDLINSGTIATMLDDAQLSLDELAVWPPRVDHQEWTQTRGPPRVDKRDIWMSAISYGRLFCNDKNSFDTSNIQGLTTIPK